MKLIAPESCYLSDLDLIAVGGAVVDVPDEVGERLVEQGWPLASDAKKTTAKKTPNPDPADAGTTEE